MSKPSKPADDNSTSSSPGEGEPEPMEQDPKEPEKKEQEPKTKDPEPMEPEPKDLESKEPEPMEATTPMVEVRGHLAVVPCEAALTTSQALVQLQNLANEARSYIRPANYGEEDEDEDEQQ